MYHEWWEKVMCVIYRKNKCQSEIEKYNDIAEAPYGEKVHKHHIKIAILMAIKSTLQWLYFPYYIKFCCFRARSKYSTKQTDIFTINAIK